MAIDDNLLLKAADAFVTKRVDEPNCSEAEQLRAALEAYEAARTAPAYAVEPGQHLQSGGASLPDYLCGVHTLIVKDPRFDELVKRLDRQEAATRALCGGAWPDGPSTEEQAIMALEQEP